MPSAAVVIIGNEILTGKFADENGPFLIRRLRALGCDLQRLVVIADDPNVIAREVLDCSSTFDHVITTGGVGPTHDDVTLASIAAGFGVPLVLEPALVALLGHFDIQHDEATLQMARVPAGTELVSHAATSYPALKFKNVWILPGVPRLMQVKFEAIAHRFAGPEIHVARLFVTEHETAIALTLTAIVARHPLVAVGSYPRFGEADYRVILTLESKDRDALDAAVAELSANLPLRPAS
jgi:FAD synthetase